jgi:hypothetical protein
VTQLLHRGVEQANGTAVLASGEMNERGGQLDNALKELPRGPRTLQPNVLPRFVRLKEETVIELADTFEDSWEPLAQFVLGKEGQVASGEFGCHERQENT